MIDPRALQQHFNKVRQREQPRKHVVPRVPDLAPLTAVQAIPIPEPIQPTVDTSELQKELLEVTQALTTLKQTLSQTPQIEPVTVTIPVSVETIITEIKESENKTEPIEKETPYGYSLPEHKADKDDYNPYGYYSGPLF